jgi:hypothetical protein
MSTGLKGLSEVVKAVLDDRESSGRNARPPATPELSLVMSRKAVRVRSSALSFSCKTRKKQRAFGIRIG